TDRQHINELRVNQPRYRAGGQQACQQRIDISADLHHSPADEDRSKVFDNFTNVSGSEIEMDLQALRKPDYKRNLYPELKPTAQHAPPRKRKRQPGRIVA